MLKHLKILRCIFFFFLHSNLHMWKVDCLHFNTTRLCQTYHVGQSFTSTTQNTEKKSYNSTSPTKFADAFPLFTCVPVQHFNFSTFDPLPAPEYKPALQVLHRVPVYIGGWGGWRHGLITDQGPKRWNTIWLLKHAVVCIQTHSLRHPAGLSAELMLTLPVPVDHAGESPEQCLLSEVFTTIHHHWPALHSKQLFPAVSTTLRSHRAWDKLLAVLERVSHARRLPYDVHTRCR